MKTQMPFASFDGNVSKASSKIATILAALELYRMDMKDIEYQHLKDLATEAKQWIDAFNFTLMYFQQKRLKAETRAQRNKRYQTKVSRRQK